MGRGPSIEGRKNAEDARKGKLFTKLIREITVAARGGADPAGNPRLRTAMNKALGENMTKDTIERAIKRGSGTLEGAQLEEIRYEGYGPGGVAILVECMTDNSTRTISEVRHAFSRNAGNMGASGSVAYLFHRLGVLSFGADVDGEKVLEVALEASAEDVISEDGHTDVITKPENFEGVKKALESAGLKPAHADISWRPDIWVDPAGNLEAVTTLLEALEGLDDVQNVYSNAKLPRAGA